MVVRRMFPDTPLKTECGTPISAREMLKKVIAVSSFFARHLIASIVSIAIPTILVVVAYFVLLAIAIITGSGLGGLLALPFWTLFAFLVATAYTSLLLFPSVLIAEIISRRFGKWHHLAQIPISTFVLAAIIVMLNLTIHFAPHYAETVALQWADYPVHIFLLLTIPLGLYWWTMKIVQTGIATPTELLKRFRATQDKVSIQEQ